MKYELYNYTGCLKKQNDVLNKVLGSKKSLTFLCLKHNHYDTLLFGFNYFSIFNSGYSAKYNSILSVRSFLIYVDKVLL